MTSKKQLRIYICGPHSTGKTTLLHDLQPYLDIEGVKVVEEVARGIIRDHGWKRADFHPDSHPDVFQQLNMEILQKQIEVDLDLSGQDCINDRGIDPIVYASYYIGKEAREALYATSGLDRWIERMRHSLVFLISPHKECIHDDNVRLASSLEELQKFHAIFEQELRFNKVPYHNITILDRKKRVEQVVAAAKAFRENNPTKNGLIG